MKKIGLSILTVLACLAYTSILSSCDSTKSYAEYVSDERHYIQQWIDYQGFEIAERFDEEQIDQLTEKILDNNIHPKDFIELGKWYQITEGDFKRLCFRINSWGNDSDNTKSKKKFHEDQDIMVRYEGLRCLNDYDYDNETNNIVGDNLDPNSFEICYKWGRKYYSNSYYAYGNSTGSTYECTSGGLGFPIRFLWEGGEASIIVPFNLASSNLSQYYYTLYYGTVRYTKPNYLPQ